MSESVLASTSSSRSLPPPFPFLASLPHPLPPSDVQVLDLVDPHPLPMSLPSCSYNPLCNALSLSPSLPSLLISPSHQALLTYSHPFIPLTLSPYSPSHYTHLSLTSPPHSTPTHSSLSTPVNLSRRFLSPACESCGCQKAKRAVSSVFQLTFAYLQNRYILFSLPSLSHLVFSARHVSSFVPFSLVDSFPSVLST